eukprot:10373897-Ditylum_brightwellii.AAC.1
MVVHGVLISLPLKPAKDNLVTALQYGCHKSVQHKATCFCAKILQQICKGYMLIIPQSSAHHIPGLCLTPPGVIPQPGHWPRPIFDYTRSSINHA